LQSDNVGLPSNGALASRSENRNQICGGCLTRDEKVQRMEILGIAEMPTTAP
jgi:hypothetical protein